MNRARLFAVLVALAPLARPQASEDQIRSLIEAAQQAEQREDLASAAGAYEKILKLKPHWASAEFNLALVYHSQQRYLEAIALLEEAIGHSPGLTSGYLFLGSSYFHTHEYEKAREALERFAKLEPASREALPLLASTYFRLGDHARAAPNFLELIRSNPGDPEPYYYLRECYLSLAGATLRELSAEAQAKYYEEVYLAQEQAAPEAAGKAIRDLIARHPDRPEGYVAFGRLLERQGRAADAEDAFAAARKLEPNSMPALISALAGSKAPGKPCRGGNDPLVSPACLVAEGDLEKATQALLAFRARPAREAREMYWSLHLFASLADRTLALLESRVPASAELAVMRAKVFEQAGQLAEAEREYDRAVGVGRGSLALVEYAKFKCRTSEFDEAIGLLQKALSVEPGSVEASGVLGEVYMIKAEAAKALPHLRAALRGNPSASQVRIYLAQALHKLNRAGDAIKVLEAAPSDPDGRIHFVLARYLFEQGRKEEAARAMKVFRERRKSGEASPAASSLSGAPVAGP